MKTLLFQVLNTCQFDIQNILVISMNKNFFWSFKINYNLCLMLVNKQNLKKIGKYV